jgi:hypothetical protein
MGDRFTLASATEPAMRSKDPSPVLRRQILGASAQYEKSAIVLKMRAAWVGSLDLKEASVLLGFRLSELEC